MPSLSDYSPYDLVLVDSMNMAGRMDWIDLSFGGHSTGMLYGFAKFILDTKTRWPGARIVFLWEGANQWRRRKYSFYKSNRKSKGDPEAFFSRVNTVRSFLRHLPVEQATLEGFEADDLAAWFVNEEPGRVLLVSKDQDWWQFVTRDGVDVQYGNRVKDRSTIQSELGFPPENMGLYKAMKGDQSDNIPGVARFPTKLAVEIANAGYPAPEWGLFDYAVEYCRSSGNDNWANKLLKERDVFDGNIELTGVNLDLIDPSKIEWVHGRPDETAVINALLRNGMENLATQYQEEWKFVGQRDY